MEFYFLKFYFSSFYYVLISVSGQEVMFHYNAEHTGDFSPVAGTIGNTVSLKWKYETGGEVKSSPVVSNGIVYVGSDDHKVYALNATNGKQLWNFTTNGPVSSTPAVGNGIVYIGSTSLYAINSTTGKQIWNFTADFPVDTDLAIVNGIIYFQAGKTYALNASDGSLIWAFSPFDDLSRNPSYSPAVANGVVYTGCIDGNIYAFNATTGSQIWNYKPPDCGCGALIFSSPAIANNAVYIVHYALGPDNYLYALNATSGQKIWDYPITEYYSSPAVSDGIVYAGDMNGNLHAINATTGQLLWKFKAGLCTSSPAAANGAVFFGSVDDSKIYAVNAKTGQQIWNYSIEDGVIPSEMGVISSPAIADGVLYIGNSDKNIYALNISGGAPLIPETRTIPTSKFPTTIPESTKAGSLSLTVICAIVFALFIAKKKLNFK